MARDYTDYVIEIHGAGDRVYFQKHLRQLKKDEPVEEFDFQGCTYLVNKDRAVRVKGYTPWRKLDRKRPLWSLMEVFRTKKVGIIKDLEPLPGPSEMEEVVTEVPEAFTCKICGFKHDEERVLKGHVTKKHKGAKHAMVVLPVMKQIREMRPKKRLVEPLHISRMHQPSGILMGPQGEASTRPTDSLLNIITPRLLKVEIEDDTYKKAYKSYRFGNVLPITQKWYIWVIVAVVGIFGILILTGNFQLPR